MNKKFPCISFFWVSFTSQEVLNKDPAVWLDRVKPPKNMFASICKLKLLNHISMIHHLVTKLFSDGNSQIVCTIEIGPEHAPFVVLVYFFPHLNMQKNC